MRVVHHCDEDKEFYSSFGGAYDGRMSTSFLLAAAALAIPHAHLALAFPHDARLTPLVVLSAVGETADLWSPYGVVIESADAATPMNGETIQITVAFGASTRDQHHGNDRQSAVHDRQLGEILGSVTFGGRMPARAITIFMDDLLQLVERTRLAGASAWQWPRSMRERIVGRALGRVIAHEIGHIVLHSGQHTSTGLMRPTHRAADLIERGRDAFVLEMPKSKAGANGRALPNRSGNK
jgi:hypothetical protein